MPAGRPTDYRDEYVAQAFRLALLGMTDAEMGAFFEVTERTIENWKIEHPEFFQSIIAGREDADSGVAEKLYRRAMGYSHEAVKIFMPAGADEPVYAPYTEHYPPDTQAASLWLRNRQPKRWRDKQEHEHTGKDGVPLVEADPAKIALAVLAIFGAAKKPEEPK